MNSIFDGYKKSGNQRFSLNREVAEAAFLFGFISLKSKPF
jgi:hypothetical protein